MVRHGAYDRVASVIEGPEQVIYKKGVFAGVCVGGTFDALFEGGRPERRCCTSATVVTKVAIFEGG